MSNRRTHLGSKVERRAHALLAAVANSEQKRSAAAAAYQARAHYRDQAEILGRARSALLPPHPRSVEQSIASALDECMRAFHALDEEMLAESARNWVADIRRFLDTSDVEAAGEAGLHLAKARTLSDQEQRDLSTAIDRLASWLQTEWAYSRALSQAAAATLGEPGAAPPPPENKAAAAPARRRRNRPTRRIAKRGKRRATKAK